MFLLPCLPDTDDTHPLTALLCPCVPLQLYVAVCTIIVMLLDPVYSFCSWWNSVTKIRFGPMTKFNF